MKAVVFDNELKLDNNYAKPTPKEGEVLIKTIMTGICNTDLEITKGYMGYKGVLGHEFVGEVVEVGSKKDENWLNKRVVGEINCGCNHDEWCYKGLQRHCPNRQTLGIWQKDGCFSEYFTLPVENIFEISNNVSNEEATFVEPIAAAVEITEQLHIKPCDKVALLGDGKLGLCISLVLSALNVDFVHIGKHQNKLDISKNAGAKTKLLSEIDENDRKSFDVVIEATGSTGGFETSLSLTKPRGVLVLKSTIAAKEGCGALITGESLGQVASQTMQSMNVTNSVVKLPVFRPVVAFDKEEIIDIAQKIDTFEISIRPYEDCCTVFLPKNPVIRPKISEAEEYEKALDIDSLVEKAVADTEELIITPMTE